MTRKSQLAMYYQIARISRLGTRPGAGHKGHAGRPGKIGGSLPRGQTATAEPQKFSGKPVGTLYAEISGGDSEDRAVWEVKAGLSKLLQDEGTPYSKVMVAWKGENQGKVLAIQGAVAHEEMLQVFDSKDNLDNWVRYSWEPQGDVMEVDIEYAGITFYGAADPARPLPKAKANIEKTQFILRQKGYTGSWHVFGRYLD